ncbi:MAG: hypothetical protein KGJ80_13715 [Chloroflexota bacterium]|nr:hypothetical protein [Chloroflexota bacterium]
MAGRLLGGKGVAVATPPNKDVIVASGSGVDEATAVVVVAEDVCAGDVQVTVGVKVRVDVFVGMLVAVGVRVGVLVDVDVFVGVGGAVV